MVAMLEKILQISWKTHLKHSKLYTFILPKVKKPPYGFFTHLLFESAIILIFGGFFLHWLSRIIKVKFECLRVPTTDFARQNTEPGGRIQIQVNIVGSQ